MKRLRIGYALIGACLVWCAGCAGLGIERRVQDNIFYSSHYPKIKIRIHPDFRYMGTYKKTSIGGNLPQGSTLESNFYLFGEVGDNNIVQKGVEIVFHKLSSGIWLPDLFSGWKLKFDVRSVRIRDQVYQHAVTATKNPFGKKDKKIIYDKGYIISNCYLMRGLARVVTRSEDTYMVICYIEDLAYNTDIKYGCDKWRSAAMHTDEQKRFLQGFLERSEKSIQILPY